MPSRRVVTGRSREPRHRFAEELRLLRPARLLRGARGESLTRSASGWAGTTGGNRLEVAEGIPAVVPVPVRDGKAPARSARVR
ncbi:MULTISPECIES: hypothetical protein [unclassified Streptomyces]|uniref:hypothetical protein n=1 Tax=unclassified Streptomyces TaxID=2593676 RepID=UPI000AD59CF9|nr:hypothetical protein [Streptomyces sp. Root1310]